MHNGHARRFTNYYTRTLPTRKTGYNYLYCRFCIKKFKKYLHDYKHACAGCVGIM